jgi:hypothetical protein
LANALFNLLTFAGLTILRLKIIHRMHLRDTKRDARKPMVQLAYRLAGLSARVHKFNLAPAATPQ